MSLEVEMRRRRDGSPNCDETEYVSGVDVHPVHASGEKAERCA